MDGDDPDVRDGMVDSAPDTVVVTTRNSPPIARAGPNQSVPLGATVQLDGSASFDVDGNALTFMRSLGADKRYRKNEFFT